MTRSRQARRLLVLFPHDLLSFTMDESGLDALADILNKIAEKPFDVALHIEHIRLAEAATDPTSTEVVSACEMYTNFYAAEDAVWARLIASKESGVDLETAAGVEELLDLYNKAENDYICACLYGQGIALC